MKKLEIVKNAIRNRRAESKPDYRDVAAVLLFIFLLPYIVSFFFGNAGIEKKEGGEQTEGEAAWGTKESGRTELFWEDIGKAEFIVCNTTAAGTEMMPLETYLISRLPATIHMEYEMEALKAQAVVLRTEMMRLYYDSKEEKEEGKAYIYVESNIVKTDGTAYERCKEAVGSTRGIYMTYDGYPINAPYFAVSAGATRNGNEVFGNENYKYLKSVVCERDFTSQDYVHSIRMSRESFLEKMQKLCPEIGWEEGKALEEAFSLNRDRAGYVLEICSERGTIAGEVFRREFSLNSSCFEWQEEGGTIVIKVKGVGHGLGFCQYGANEAAKKGSDYIDILNYFFSEIVIEKTE